MSVKMRKLFSLRYYAVCLMLEHLFLQRMTSFALGSFESVSPATCESKDANLTWRNKPEYSPNDVQGMAWYKGKGKDSLIATWEDGKGFKEYASYIGRLMQIGETGIRLRAADISDNGSYWLSLTLASTAITKLEAVTHLEVIVAPSSQCKPKITEEGSLLKAQVPSVGCGTPPLSPKWKNTSKTLIQEAQNQSILDLGGDFEAGEYTVCAEGYSAICYQGNISDLCTVITSSFESVSTATCEPKDANLTWRNKPGYLPNDVKAMSWYKGKDSLIATWLDGKGFKEYTPYVGRLMQIGETGIRLRAANISDNGSYSLSLTLASTHRQLEAVTHLEVIVAPSSQCKPKITEEGSLLRAQVPSVECGTPPLSPKWKNTSKTLIQEAQNQSLLDLGGDFEAGEYIVCAEGYSAICYLGNISDLCTVISKSHHGRHDDEWTPNLVSIILPVVLVALIGVIVSILALIWWKRQLICRDRKSVETFLDMEDKHTDIEEPILQTEETDTLCNERNRTSSQRNSATFHTEVNKLDEGTYV